MSANANGHRDDEMVRQHITIMNNNKNRSESNTHRLDSHDRKIDSLFELHSALKSVQNEIKHISIKMDDLKVDKELHQNNLESQKEQNEALVKAITESNKKTFREKVEDWIVPILLISLTYMVVQAFNDGILF